MTKQETRQVKNQIIKKYVILESEEREFSYHDFIVDCSLNNLTGLDVELTALELLSKLFEDNTGYLQDFIYSFMLNLKYSLYSSCRFSGEYLGLIWENSRLCNNNYTAHNLRTLWTDIKESEDK